MQITADLITHLYLNESNEIPQIVNNLIKEIRSRPSSNSDLFDVSRNRLFAILHILASRHSDTKSIELAKKVFKENNEIRLHDIQNWTIIPGFAGHFNTIEEANSHGCVIYSDSIKQQSILDLSVINKPLQIHELNTRYQRLHYAASLAIGKKKAVKVIDLGGGSGSYYILLRRLFPDVHIDYTCIDFDESRPLNADEIGNTFCHIPTIKQCEAPNSCDLFIASSVLQYMSDEQRKEVIKPLSQSRVSLLDRCPITNNKSFWTIQTRSDCRHPCKIFNTEELCNLADPAHSRTTLAEGICPEDWIKIFNMKEFYFANTTLCKWLITCKGFENPAPENVAFNDFVLY